MASTVRPECDLAGVLTADGLPGREVWVHTLFLPRLLTHFISGWCLIGSLRYYCNCYAQRYQTALLIAQLLKAVVV